MVHKATATGLSSDGGNDSFEQDGWRVRRVQERRQVREGNKEDLRGAEGS